MMADLLTRNNKEIDFEKIEFELRKAIKKREKKDKRYNKDIIDFQINNEKIKNALDHDYENDKPKGDTFNKKYHVDDKENLLLRDLIANFDIKIPRNITSHRPIIGSTLIKIRKMLNEEIRMSLDPVIDKQIEFNKKVIECFGGGSGGYLMKRTEELGGQVGYLMKRRNELEDLIKKLSEKIEENTIQTNFNMKEIFKLKRKIDSKNGD